MDGYITLGHLNQIISWFNYSKPIIELQTPDTGTNAKMTLYVANIRNVVIYSGHVAFNGGDGNGYTVWKYQQAPYAFRPRFYSITSNNHNDIKYKTAKKLYNIMQNLYTKQTTQTHR